MDVHDMQSANKEGKFLRPRTFVIAGIVFAAAALRRGPASDELRSHRRAGPVWRSLLLQ